MGLLASQYLFAEVSDFACGSLSNAFGPYDYRSDKDKLGIVERAHLTPEVINLTRGKSGVIGADIDYTLRAFPNHHLALMAIVRLGQKQGLIKPIGAKYSVECYLHRATRFRSGDAMVKIIYADFLARNKRGTEAIQMLDEVLMLGEENANIYYNMGLIYLDIKQYDKALQYAHMAYRMGFPLPGFEIV